VGYVQSRALSDQISGRKPSFYSAAAELWYTSEKLAQTARWPDLNTMLKPDVTQQAMLLGMERVVLRLPAHHTARHIKGIFPFRRKRDMTAEDFQYHWWHRHGPIAALTENALCYVQIHPPLESGQSEILDGITELHWSNRREADQAMQSRQMREDQGNDAVNFVDPGSVELFLVEEEVVIAP